jgi:hypothetical protein
MASVTFFLLTFAITWACWLLPAVLPWGRTGMLALGGPVFLLGVFTPALVALALTAKADGVDGAARLLARIGRWRVAWPLYVFALSYNNTTFIVPAAVPGADNPMSLDASLVGWITVAVSWLVAAPCLHAMRGVRTVR